MARVRKLARRFDPFYLTVFSYYLVAYCRGGLDYLDIVLTFEAFLYDFHVQKAKKTATETKAKCRRVLRTERKTRVVQGEFVESVPEFCVICVWCRDKNPKIPSA